MAAGEESGHIDYQEIYDKHSWYGSAHGNHCPGVRLLPKYIHWLSDKVVDLGCGRGDTAMAIRKMGLSCDGIDMIKCHPDMKVGDITKPLDLSEYSTAICMDVFEHIPDKPLIGLMENMAKVDRCAFSIHNGPSSAAKGVELHVNRKLFEDWRPILRKYFDIVEEVRIKGDQSLFICTRKHVDSKCRPAIIGKEAPDAECVVLWVYKKGGDFDKFPNELHRARVLIRDQFNAIQATTRKDIEYILLTDDAELPVPAAIRKVPLKHDMKGWFSKFEMFRTDYMSGDRPVLFLDLETRIHNNIDDLFDLDINYFYMIRDWYHPDRVGTGVMVFKANAHEHVLKTFRTQSHSYDTGDQGIIQANVQDKLRLLQDHTKDLIYSYKVHCRDGLMQQEECPVLCFHGPPRPWQVPVGRMPGLSRRGKLVVSYLNFHPDPQAGRGVPSNSMPYLNPWYNTTRSLGLPAIVLHDNLSEKFIEAHQTDRIRFLKVTPGPYSPNDYRWCLYNMLIQECCSDVDYVLFTDCSDVSVRKDPFEIINDPQQLYIGSEFEKRTADGWMQARFAECNSAEISKVAAQIRDRLLLNCGIVGGHVKTMQFFMERVSAVYRAVNPGPRLYLDMAVINFVAYKYFKDHIVTGAPLLNRFKGNDRSDTYLWHK